MKKLVEECFIHEETKGFKIDSNLQLLHLILQYPMLQIQLKDEFQCLKSIVVDKVIRSLEKNLVLTPIMLEHFKLLTRLVNMNDEMVSLDSEMNRLAVYNVAAFVDRIVILCQLLLTLSTQLSPENATPIILLFARFYSRLNPKEHSKFDISILDSTIILLVHMSFIDIGFKSCSKYHLILNCLIIINAYSCSQLYVNCMMI